MNKELIEKVVRIEWTMPPGDGVETPLGQHVDFVARCLARIDAERGKDAVGKLVDEGFKQIEWINKPPVGSLLFLSPTIPEGMARVPIEPTNEMIDAADYQFKGPRSDFVEMYKVMLAAAQGERNAD